MAYSISNDIEMVDAIEFNVQSIENFQVNYIYIEKNNILAYYFAYSEQKLITVQKTQTNPISRFREPNNIKSTKISIKEVERLQMILQLTQELEELNKNGWTSFNV
jgi:hypothetical protein